MKTKQTKSVPDGYFVVRKNGMPIFDSVAHSKRESIEKAMAFHEGLTWREMAELLGFSVRPFFIRHEHA